MAAFRTSDSLDRVPTGHKAGQLLASSALRAHLCRHFVSAPAGFDAKPAPFGVTFTGASCSEPRLVAIAYAFEQASRKRVPPPDLP